MTSVEKSRETTKERIVSFIGEYTAEHGYPPTNREIAAGVGRDVSTVNAALWRLRYAGRVTWVEGKTRTLRLVA